MNKIYDDVSSSKYYLMIIIIINKVVTIFESSNIVDFINSET